jgi:hypothetical protein
MIPDAGRKSDIIEQKEVSQLQSRVLEGPWEEIASHADELAGRRVRVEIVDNSNTDMDDDRPIPIDEAISAYLNRSPEEKAAARARVLASVQPGRPLPPGKTLRDVIVGKWPGNETDEEIAAALEELS